ncbi:MAG: DMT family transporter [Candidatus Nanopelagicales bacterium]|nr:DMT family transporter [Candidatus Nanopelagicales bacterium]
MSTTAILAIVLVLLAAATEALSNVLQHKATNQADPTRPDQRAGELAALLRTLRMPLFLLGFLLMIVGYAFHVASLGMGNLAIIQVIFVSQLVFVLPLSRLVSRTRISPRDWLGAVMVTVGIGAFVVFAQPTEGEMNLSNGLWLGVVGLVGLACLVFILLGYRFRGGTRAALIGCSGGLINGLVAPLTKGTIAVAGAGTGALFGSWFLYVTVLAALLGVAFPLMAYRSGPITASFPAVMSLNPITATFLGVWLFHEHLNGSLLNVVVMIASAVLIFVGIIWLSRSKAIAAAFEESTA